MAHFAEIDEENKVVNVIVLDNSILKNKFNIETESIGIEFLRNIYGNSKKFVQCSVNHKFRDIFPFIGDMYDPNKDVFVTKRLHCIPPHWQVKSINDKLDNSTLTLDDCEIIKNNA